MGALMPDAELLSKLVSFDSTSDKSNLSIVDFICDYLDDSRITLVRQDDSDGDKYNVVARVAVGEAVKVVPDRCVADLGIRLPPGMDSAAMIDRVRGPLKSRTSPTNCSLSASLSRPAASSIRRFMPFAAALERRRLRGYSLTCAEPIPSRDRLIRAAGVRKRSKRRRDEGATS